MQKRLLGNDLEVSAPGFGCMGLNFGYNSNISEAGTGRQSIRRAHAILQIADLQSKYSLFWLQPEMDTLPLLEELNIGLVPFSPLGKGHLTGTIKKDAIFHKDDFRNIVPGFCPENAENIKFSALDRQALKALCQPLIFRANAIPFK